MHTIKKLIKNINKTHKKLGPLIAINITTAKARRTILNIAPAGCGKSAATNTVHRIMRNKAVKYTSLTLAGLKHIATELSEFGGHLIIDDLGSEKSIWSRTSTITVLANLVHTHYVHKITQGYEILIENFQGSCALNIQPVLINSLVQDEDWIAVVRDKVLRYYHLIRPIKPKSEPPNIEVEWGQPLAEVAYPRHRGKLWYQLIAIGLTQWSYARCLEHIPQLLRALAALDHRTQVELQDYRLLIKMLKPMQLERYIIQSFGFEAGRVFDNNLYCILVELASYGEPSIEIICEDYKVSPATVTRLAKTVPDWCYIKTNSPQRICPMPQTQKILKLVGANQKW